MAAENGKYLGVNFELKIQNGPIVDKDGISEVLQGYKALLKGTGVKGTSLQKTMETVERVIYDGNPNATRAALENVQDIVSACRTTPTGKKI